MAIYKAKREGRMKFFPFCFDLPYYLIIPFLPPLPHILIQDPVTLMPPRVDIAPCDRIAYRAIRLIQMDTGRKPAVTGKRFEFGYLFLQLCRLAQL